MRISLHRSIYLILLGIFTVIFVSACTTAINTSAMKSKQPIEDCRVVKHIMGETCVPRNPQRVVTLRVDHLANSLALGIQPIASAYYTGFPLQKYLQN
jgi:iron complex transport system substrate-binding protein